MTRDDPAGRIEIIAHRGYSARAPENTVASVRAALTAGATAVEWDLQVSASGTPYLFHDDSLDRTTNGVGLFAESTDAVIDRLEACLLYTSPSPRDATLSRMPSSA